LGGIIGSALVTQYLQALDGLFLSMFLTLPYGFARFSLQSPPMRANRICACGRFDGVTKAQSGVGIMLFLCKMEAVPKVLYGKHRCGFHRMIMQAVYTSANG
jgi:hypothetical protein